MAGDRIERLHYYQRQFLGAADFEAQQDYHRCMRRRHSLGPHTFGIVTGLELVEVAPEGGGQGVDVYVLPGLAVDGFGREILVLEPAKLDLGLFEAYRNEPDRFLPVFLAYQEEPGARARLGFDRCADRGEQFSRLQETFRLVIDPEEPFEDELVVAGRVARVAGDEGGDELPGVLAHLEVPRDRSVPYQELPEEDDDERLTGPRWLIRLGTVHWHLDHLEADDEEPPLLSRDRLYAGNVTAEILAPVGELLIRDRRAPELLPDDATEPFHGGVEARLQGSLDIERGATVGGRLGVGTDDPQARLHVADGDPASLSEHGHVLIGEVEGANLVLDPDDVMARADGASAALHLQREGGGLHVHGASPESGVALLADGRLGLGTASPRVKLHVEGGEDATLADAEAGYLVLGEIGETNLVLDDNEIMARDNGVGSLLHLQADGGGLAIHNNGGTARVRIQDDGRVGIGHANPAVKLHVTGGTDVSPGGGGFLVLGALGERNVAFDGNEIMARDDGATSTLHLQGQGGQLRVFNSLGSPQRVVFRDTGRLGLGVEEPVAKLHIEGGSDAHLGDSAGYVVLGEVDGLNLVLDNDEVMVRNNGVAASLRLQAHGGEVRIHDLRAAAEQVRVREDGRVGLGTISPRVKLHVESGTDVTLGDETGYLVLGSVDDLNVAFDNNEIQARNNGAAAALFLQREGGALNLHDAQPESEQVVVTNAGDVGIGTNSPSFKLDVEGTVRAHGFTPPSDKRLKTNIETLEDALEGVAKLRGVRFDWDKEIETKRFLDDRPQLGFIAQEVEDIFPELVHTDSEDLKSINTMGLIPVLAEAVKTLQQRLEEMEERLESLENHPGLDP